MPNLNKRTGGGGSKAQKCTPPRPPPPPNPGHKTKTSNWAVGKTSCLNCLIRTDSGVLQEPDLTQLMKYRLEEKKKKTVTRTHTHTQAERELAARLTGFARHTHTHTHNFLHLPARRAAIQSSSAPPPPPLRCFGDRKINDALKQREPLVWWHFEQSLGKQTDNDQNVGHFESKRNSRLFTNSTNRRLEWSFF